MASRGWSTGLNTFWLPRRLELVHDSARDRVEPGGLNHLVIKVEAMRETIAHLAARGIETEPPSSPDGSEDF